MIHLYSKVKTCRQLAQAKVSEAEEINKQAGKINFDYGLRKSNDDYHDLQKIIIGAKL